MKIESSTHPLKIAKWLSIAQAQRKRGLNKVREDFGDDAAAAANQEVVEITACINEMLKAATDAPKKS